MNLRTSTHDINMLIDTFVIYLEECVKDEIYMNNDERIGFERAIQKLKELRLRHDDEQSST